MEPYESVDLTEIVEECEGTFLVYRSPDSSEDDPDYELIAECETRELAEQFLRDNEAPDSGAWIVD